MMTTVNKLFDAKRAVKGTVQIYADARCVVPVSNVDYSDLSIVLGSHTLTDTFTMQVPLQALALDYETKGTLKDFNYQFKVEETSETAGIYSYTGRYSTDKLRYTNYRLAIYTRPSDGQTPPDTIAMPVRTILQGMCGCLGLTLNYQAWNWSYPLPQLYTSSGGTVIYGLNGTYSALISQLFGWLSDLPHIDFNVFIRGNTLNVIQRGQETGNTYDLSSYHVGAVYTTNKRRLRTEWQGNTEKPQNEYDDPDTQQPFTGSIAFGPCRITYEDGYLTREENTDTGSITTYQYTDINDIDGNSQKYLQTKETIDDDIETCSKTEYEYATLGNEIYLAMETVYTGGEVVSNSTDYTDAEITKTTHTPIGNGWYGHTTYDADGEVVETSLSQGSPGNTVTQYMVDKTQEVFKSEAVEIAEAVISGLLTYLHPPVVSTNYPVKDRQTIEDLIDATDWLDGRIEERVTLEVLESAHIFDFNDLIQFNGNIYRLESNSIRHSAENGLRQGLEIVRWY